MLPPLGDRAMNMERMWQVATSEDQPANEGLTR